MSRKTESEVLFEQLCHELGINCKPVPRANKKTPDYDVLLGTHLVNAEVKQLDLNDDDSLLFEEARKRGTACGFCNIDDRLRRKIQKAAQQLKARSMRAVPALAVVYDNGTFGGIDEIDIKTAMYGDEKVVVSLIEGDVAHVSPLHAGGNRQMTEMCNTTISAVGLLDRPAGKLTISLYHNRFAACPINPDWFRHDRFRHFALSSVCYGWIEM